ncbi:hypothetical protein QF026_005629 [Streptomyces aurantiacus]|nr:hypothetical protein [Streptomyces aurantiacus]
MNQLCLFRGLERVPCELEHAFWVSASSGWAGTRTDHTQPLHSSSCRPGRRAGMRCPAGYQPRRAGRAVAREGDATASAGIGPVVTGIVRQKLASSSGQLIHGGLPADRPQRAPSPPAFWTGPRRSETAFATSRRRPGVDIPADVGRPPAWPAQGDRLHRMVVLSPTRTCPKPRSARSHQAPLHCPVPVTSQQRCRAGHSGNRDPMPCASAHPRWSATDPGPPPPTRSEAGAPPHRTRPSPTGRPAEDPSRSTPASSHRRKRAVGEPAEAAQAAPRATPESEYPTTAPSQRGPPPEPPKAPPRPAHPTAVQASTHCRTRTETSAPPPRP